VAAYSIYLELSSISGDCLLYPQPKDTSYHSDGDPVFNLALYNKGGCDSSVGIVLGYGLDNQGAGV
jgi:hypothetical protein